MISVWGLGFRDRDLRFGFWGFRIGALGLEIELWGSRSKDWVSGLSCKSVQMHHASGDKIVGAYTEPPLLLLLPKNPKQWHLELI